MRIKQFNLFESKNEDVDSKYTKKVKRPQYLPSKNQPNIAELCNYEKYGKLLKTINASNLSDEEKRFLRMAASRHIVFNYSKIADYYAHASAEMQTLMEKSALVIIDVDDAIANGYIKLSTQIDKILEESGESTDE